jgi:hypothetical protein
MVMIVVGMSAALALVYKLLLRADKRLIDAVKREDQRRIRQFHQNYGKDSGRFDDLAGTDSGSIATFRLPTP